MCLRYSQPKTKLQNILTMAWSLFIVRKMSSPAIASYSWLFMISSLWYVLATKTKNMNDVINGHSLSHWQYRLGVLKVSVGLLRVLEAGGYGVLNLDSMKLTCKFGYGNLLARRCLLDRGCGQTEYCFPTLQSYQPVVGQGMMTHDR